MAEYNSTSPPNIAALPPTTVSQLGSSNVLSDPSSVVKELIDNALDARTNAIFVDITANTLDSIQVKDTGHGISAEDRPLVCRRYCTSKIRDFHDLGEVGGKWLGFRGEALASMAEMSGVLEVTTRVEGELVAVKLKYGRDGGLQSTEHASAPVGTAVKVTNFFQTLPVRRETALKESAKTLAKIKRLMQAYAFARPTVRFSLRVLKAKSNKGDFMNAPKKDANVEDAVLKIIGKHCALQCDWTAMESEGFEIHAFLPKPDAVGSKIANEGAFFSVDGRPVSASRGTPKKIVASFKERLRRANPGLSSVRDPLFCINITCPPGSYDTNIEPAKDDVLFEREDIVVGAVTKLFAAYYPENAVVSNVDDEPESPVPPVLTARVSSGVFHDRPETAFSILEGPTVDRAKHPETALSILEEVRPVEKLHPPVSAPLRWRSNMYGIDEEDLELLDSENQPPVIEEEEEGRRAANVSNPWTIARMNAKVKTPQSKSNGQLMTPAKTHADVTMSLTSPAPSSNTHQPLLLEPLTQTVSRTNVSARPRDSVLQGSMERPSQIAGPGFQAMNQQTFHTEGVPSTRNTRTRVPVNTDCSSSPISRRIGKNKQPRGDQQSLHAFEGRPNHNGWFNQPMRRQAPPKSSRARKSQRASEAAVPMFDIDGPRQVLTSKNNTDIRDFLGWGANQLQRSTSLEPTSGPSSFTPINRPFRPPRILDDEGASRSESLRSSALASVSQASSAEPLQRSRPVRNRPQHRSIDLESLDFTDQLRAYAEREDQQLSSGGAPSLDLEPALAPPDNRAENTRLPTARSRTTDQEMVTMFVAYNDPPNAPINQTRPRDVKGQPTQPVHAAPTKSLPQRRRTTDGGGPQRTKSSRLRLQRIPQGYRIQNVVLRLHTTLRAITASMQKLDMRRNTPEWGCPVDASTFDVFTTTVMDDTVRAWVRRLDEMLEGFDTQLDEETVVMTLERSIAGALRDRQVEWGVQADEVVQPGLEDCLNGLDQLREWVQGADPAREVQMPEASSAGLAQTVAPVGVAEGGDEFGGDEFGGDDFDDEMLMEF